MLMEGVRLMIVGMFMVFAFLTLLVGLMKGSASFFEAFAHRFPEEPSSRPKSVESARNEEIAIALAVAEAKRQGRKV